MIYDLVTDNGYPIIIGEPVATGQVVINSLGVAGTSRTRVPSCSVREFKRGKFLLASGNIILQSSIGEGMYQCNTIDVY